MARVAAAVVLAAQSRRLAVCIVAWFGVALFLGLETNAIVFVYAGTAVALSRAPEAAGPP